MANANTYRIMEVVSKDEPKLLIDQAKALSQDLQGGARGQEQSASKTQVRQLFGTLRQIETKWPSRMEDPADKLKRDDAYRELVLFSPRLEYQARRHRSLGPLARTIQEGILHVDKGDRKTLQRLVQFFEAVVAYYAAD